MCHRSETLEFLGVRKSMKNGTARLRVGTPILIGCRSGGLLATLSQKNRDCVYAPPDTAIRRRLAKCTSAIFHLYVSLRSFTLASAVDNTLKSSKRWPPLLAIFCPTVFLSSSQSLTALSPTARPTPHRRVLVTTT